MPPDIPMASSGSGSLGICDEVQFPFSDRLII
jgi:hypothetical protein